MKKIKENCLCWCLKISNSTHPQYLQQKPYMLHTGTRKYPRDAEGSRVGFSRWFTGYSHTNPAHMVPAKSWRKDTADKLHKAHHSISHTTAQLVLPYHWIFHCLISMGIPTPSRTPSCCKDIFHYPSLKWRKTKSRISSSRKLSSLHSPSPYSSTSCFQTFVQIDKPKVCHGSSLSSCLLRNKS